MKPTKIQNIEILAVALFFLAVNSSEVLADSVTSASSVIAPRIFATVGDAIITRQEYDDAFTELSRKKYYHAKPPVAEIATMQRRVGDTLVTNTLLLAEAKRRGLKSDTIEVAKKLQIQEKLYASSERWQQVRDVEIPKLTKQYQEESLLSNLEKLVRKPPKPSEKQLREYYAAHLDKFLVPPQMRVSVILLKVDPSSPSSVWQEALAKGQALVKRLRDGADFAEMAREISDDPSADQGGDMGYLHAGMLDEAAQQTVDKLEPGAVSDPIGLMEGITIFRLTERRPARQNSFESGHDRIRDAWLEVQSEIVWQTFVAELKKQTPVHIDESHYLPIIPEGESNENNMSAPSK